MKDVCASKSNRSPTVGDDQAVEIGIAGLTAQPHCQAVLARVEVRAKSAGDHGQIPQQLEDLVHRASADQGQAQRAERGQLGLLGESEPEVGSTVGVEVRVDLAEPSDGHLPVALYQFDLRSALEFDDPTEVRDGAGLKRVAVEELDERQRRHAGFGNSHCTS